MKKILELIMNSEISNVSYINSSSSYNSLSEAVLQSYDFNNSLIFEEWSNGLRIYANLNRTGWWNFTAHNGKVLNLPPNGLYAYVWNDSSFEECFNCDNTSTWVKTPDYLYLYPKNDQTITFSVPREFYNAYVFYGDDSSNGRRLVYTSPVAQSTYTTDMVSILTVVSDIDPNFTDRSFYNSLAVVLIIIGIMYALGFIFYWGTS